MVIICLGWSNCSAAMYHSVFCARSHALIHKAITSILHVDEADLRCEGALF